MSKVIAFVNQKGGVGKTTSTMNVAAALNARKKSVLMVDLDPQASLTVYAGEDENELEDQERTLYYGLMKEKPLSELIIGQQLPLIASSITLSDLERELILDAWRSPRILFRDKLATIRNQFDYILLDCPPTLGLLTINGLVAADFALIPVKTDFLSIKGIEGLLATIEEVKSKANYDLKILGVLPTMYNPKNNHDNRYLDSLRSVMEGVHFFEPINRSTGFDKSAAEAIPTLIGHPKTPGVQNYNQIADYLIAHE